MRISHIVRTISVSIIAIFLTAFSVFAFNSISNLHELDTNLALPIPTLASLDVANMPQETSGANTQPVVAIDTSDNTNDSDIVEQSRIDAVDEGVVSSDDDEAVSFVAAPNNNSSEEFNTADANEDTASEEILIVSSENIIRLMSGGDTLVVNSTANTNTATEQANCQNGNANCTLPAAVAYANTLGTHTTITFDLSAGVQRITASEILITESMTIDATTHTGYAGTPLIELAGSQIADEDGFVISGADTVTIRGFAIGNFLDPNDTVPIEAGILIQQSATNITIEDNWIGLDATGAVFSNGLGIFSNGFNASLPTNVVLDGNVLSGNMISGAWLRAGGLDIFNNIVGLDPTGQTAISNNVGTNSNNGGLFVMNESDEVDIGTTMVDGNVIAGNRRTDLRIESGTPNVRIRGNYLGTDSTGMMRLSPNATNALVVEASQFSPTSGTIIGGSNANQGNVIVASLILGGRDDDGNVTTADISVIGNHIGVNSMADAAFSGNLQIDAKDSLIQGNILAGNGGTSSSLIANGDGTTIVGNYIGITPAGLNLGGEIGLLLRGANMHVGGSTADDANYISGAVYGIVVQDDSDPNDGDTPTNVTIEGNKIGLDPTDNTDTATIPNEVGIQVSIRATGTKIGVAGGNPNIIVGNTRHGILIGGDGGNSSSDVVPDNTQIVNNYIGRNASGTAIGNGGDGIHMRDGQNVTVGDDTQAGMNYIVNNGGAGIALDYTTDEVSNSGNVFLGNIIVDNGGLGIDLNNDGVTLNDTNGDRDWGANDLQNYPELLSLVVDDQANTTTVEFELNGRRYTDYRIDFYYNVGSCDTSGYGEGMNWITNVPVPAEFSTDDVGFYTGTIVITGLALENNELISVLATDLDRGNTSEFSRCPLSPPADFEANTISQVQIDLAWSGNHPDADEMTIERSMDGASNWSELASFALPNMAYSDTDLSCGTTYYYRALGTDTNEAVESGYTNVVSGTTSACPPNDDFANAIVISNGSLPYSDNQQTYGATEELEDWTPSCGTDMAKTIWYRFTPNEDAEYVISTSGSNFDTVVSIWTNSGSPEEVDCNDDSGPGATSFLRETLMNGVTYYILVGGDNAQGGVVNISLDQEPEVNEPPPVAPIAPIENAVGLFDPASAMWYFVEAFVPEVKTVRFQFGSPSPDAQALIGDWNGDGTEGIGIYQNGQVLQREARNGGSIDNRFTVGLREAGWQAVAGDFNGDGTDTIALYKDGMVIISSANETGASTSRAFVGDGQPEWQAVAGDFNGDGTDTIALYRDGLWLIPGVGRVRFGSSQTGWWGIVGDWDDDDVETIGVNSGSIWRLRNYNAGNMVDVGFNFGSSSSTFQPLVYNSGAMAVNALSVLPPEFNELEVTEIPIEATPEATEPVSEMTEMPLEITPEVTEAPIEATPEATEPVSDVTPEATEVPLEMAPDVIEMPVAETTSEPELPDVETTQEVSDSGD